MPSLFGFTFKYGKIIANTRAVCKPQAALCLQNIKNRRGRAPLVHMKGQNFIAGALILSLGGIAAKLMGAFYRIPLANILGGEGMGIYQMVYPLYCLLLTLSATGIPAGLARIVAQSEAKGNAAASRASLRRALFVFSAIGAAASVFMFAAAPFMSFLQQEPAAAPAYRMLAPGIAAVAVLSCFRGYFQGKGNFCPTALSELVEQAVKIALGLYFACRFREDAPRAVAYALFAVTVSEFAAAAFMAACAFFFARSRRSPLYIERAEGEEARSVFRRILPVAVSSCILPLSNIADSIVIVRLAGRYLPDVTALYGVFSGGANALVSLPVSVCYGLAAALVPLSASLYAQKKYREAEQKTAFALKCTLFLSLPAALFLFAFPQELAALLFGGMTQAERAWLVRLVRILSAGAVFLSCVQTLSACLTGRGKAKTAAVFMAAGAAVKLILEALLVKNEKISLSGAAIAAIACYFVALLGDLLYSIRDKKVLARTAFDFVRFLVAASAAAAAAYPLRTAGALPPFAVMAALYLLLVIAGRCFTKEELGLIRRIKKNDHHRRAGLLQARSHRGRKGSDPVGR